MMPDYKKRKLVRGIFMKNSKLEVLIYSKQQPRTQMTKDLPTFWTSEGA